MKARERRGGGEYESKREERGARGNMKARERRGGGI